MIITTVSHWQQYRLGRIWEQALAFAAAATPDMEIGRYEIAGSDAYGLVSEYTTVPEAEKPYETHDVYMDVQRLLRGREWLDYTPAAELVASGAYNAERDYTPFVRPGRFVNRLLLGGDVIAALYPEDGHCPGIAVDGVPAPVKKLVVKVRVCTLVGCGGE